MYDVHVSALYFKEHNIPMEDIKAWIFQHTWTRGKIFKLVSHGNAGRPCMTNRNPEDGKLCIFPFVYPDCKTFPQPAVCQSSESKEPVVHTKCLDDGTSDNRSFHHWCSTRTHVNNSHIKGHFGKCSQHCKDQINATENLASSDFAFLWEEGFYRLLNDDIGHCHSYNPGGKSAASSDDKFVALLGM